jgi:SAM-dependent methyltransferase
MAAVCPIGFDIKGLKNEVRRTYASVATHLVGEFHFHRGPEYAARQLGYDRDELARLPRISTEPFTGVGNPFRMGRLPAGATVVDVGSGAGMDCLLAGIDVGAAGRVIGIDMTDEMLERGRSGAAQMGLTHVRFEKADMERLPFAEIHRVLRPGGRLQFADLIIGTELSEDARNDIDLWAG